ncbi:hypothetical protein RCL1_000313 [Eukaryota sp. TZLM3-RCL]
MPEVVYQFSKPASQFRQRLIFKSRNASELGIDFRSSTAPTDTVTARLVSTETNTVVPSFSDRSTQSNTKKTLSQSTSYESRTLLDNESALSDPKLASFLTSTSLLLEKILSLNSLYTSLSSVNDQESDNIIQLLEQDSGSTLTDVQSFTELLYSAGKNVSCLDLSSTFTLASYAPFSSLDDHLCSSLKPNSYYSLIWSLNDSLTPQFVLESTSPVMTSAINHFEPCHVALGLFSGGISVYKCTGSGSSGVPPLIPPVATSDVTLFHSHLVISLTWLSKSELVSIGSEGIIKYWNFELITSSNQSNYELKLIRVVSLNAINQTVKNEFDLIPLRQAKLINQSKLIGLSDCGVVVVADLTELISSPTTPTNHAQSLSVSESAIKLTLSDYTVVSPFLDWSINHFDCDLIATVEHNFITIWYNTAPIFSIPSTVKRTCIAFSNLRPSLFVTGRLDGSIECWDLIVKLNEPLFVASVSSSAITKVAFLTGSRHLIVGDSSGNILIKSITTSFHQSFSNNDNNMIDDLIEGAVLMADFSRLKSIEVEKSLSGGNVFDRFSEGESNVVDYSKLSHIKTSTLLSKSFSELQSEYEKMIE